MIIVPATPSPRQPVTTDYRTTLTRFAAQSYASGASIRTIARQTGRSYGFIHRLLDTAGVPRRRPGRQPNPTRAAGLRPRATAKPVAVTNDVDTVGEPR